MKNPFRAGVAEQGGRPLVRLNPFIIGLTGGLGVLLALLIGQAVSQLSTVLVYIGLALFLALGLDPLVSLIERKLPRPAAIAIVVFGVLALLAGVLLAVVPIIVREASALINNLPGYVTDVQRSAWFDDLQTNYGDAIGEAVTNGTDFLRDPNNLLSIGGGLLAVGAGIASGTTATIIVVILTLYFLASMRSMKQALYRFIPAYRRPAFAGISDQITGAVGRYVIGQLSLAATNGVLSLIYLSIVQAPVAPLLALFAFIGSLIPLVGTLSASVINTAIAFAGGPVTGIAVGIYYLVYMQVEAYVISPRIMSRAVAVPGAVVVIAAVAGGTLGGILGALVAIPIAASAIIIIQKVVYPRQDAQTEAPSEALVQS